MNKRDYKYILKRVITFFIIYLIIHFISGCEMVHAYVYLETNNGNAGLPTNVSQITNPLNTWPNSGYLYMRGSNDWLLSLGQYWYNSSMNGNEMIVEADYWFGIETVSGTLPYYYYITNGDARNTLKSENLRCGIGSAFRSGYDSTYAPQITNFSVSVRSDLSDNSYPHTSYHITFKYQQKLSSNKTGGSNMSCWFERIPSNGLFTQVYGSTVNNLYFGYTSNLSYAVSNDPNTSALQTITSQNSTIINQNQQQINNQNTMINQNNQIIQEEKNTQNKINDNTNAINNQTNTIKDTNISGASSQMDSFLNSITINDNKGISGVITMPLRLVNNFNQSCSGIDIHVPFLDADVTIPCMKPIYTRFIGSTTVTIISELINTFIVYNALVLLFIRTKELKDPEEDKVEVVFL